MELVVQGHRIDINVEFIPSNLSSYTEEETEIDRYQNDDEIPYIIKGYTKVKGLNKDIDVEIQGSINTYRFLEYVDEFKTYGAMPGCETYIDTEPNISLIIPNKFENLNDIAMIWNFYIRHNLNPMLLSDWNTILYRCPKLTNALKEYCMKHDDITTLVDDYFDIIDNIYSSAISISVIKDRVMDFNWVEPKFQNEVFEELTKFINSKINFKELSKLCRGKVEFRIK